MELDQAGNRKTTTFLGVTVSCNLSSLNGGGQMNPSDNSALLSRYAVCAVDVDDTPRATE
jgi:hypothetical protein